MMTGARSVGYERIVCSVPRYGLNGHSRSGVLTETEPGESLTSLQGAHENAPVLVDRGRGHDRVGGCRVADRGSSEGADYSSQARGTGSWLARSARVAARS